MCRKFWNLIFADVVFTFNPQDQVMRQGHKRAYIAQFIKQTSKKTNRQHNSKTLDSLSVHTTLWHEMELTIE